MQLKNSDRPTEWWYRVEIKAKINLREFLNNSELKPHSSYILLS